MNAIQQKPILPFRASCFRLLFPVYGSSYIFHSTLEKLCKRMAVIEFTNRGMRLANSRIRCLLELLYEKSSATLEKKLELGGGGSTK